MTDAMLDVYLFEVNRTVDKPKYLPVLQFARAAETCAYHGGAKSFRETTSTFVLAIILASCGWPT